MHPNQIYVAGFHSVLLLRNKPGNSCNQTEAEKQDVWYKSSYERAISTTEMLGTIEDNKEKMYKSWEMPHRLNTKSWI